MALKGTALIRALFLTVARLLHSTTGRRRSALLTGGGLIGVSRRLIAARLVLSTRPRRRSRVRFAHTVMRDQTHRRERDVPDCTGSSGSGSVLRRSIQS